jgi:uncharacterized membrane protein YcaP (DUF421 family)
LLPTVPVWELALRAVLIYGGLLVALRLFGKRQVGQFTLYDLVFIVLVANALQPAITGPDNTLLGGFVLIAAFGATNFLISRISLHPRFHRILMAPAAVVVRNGRMLKPTMEREGVQSEEIESAMRDHGIDDIGDVRLGVLEPDGTISIVGAQPASDGDRRTRKNRIRRSRNR